MRIVAATPQAGFSVWLEFDDGAQGIVDLSDLAGRGVFAAWLEREAFADVAPGSGGELTWACGVDLCADALYLRLTGGRPEDLFPALRGEAGRA